MVRFRKEIIREISDHIVRLGLEKCPVCSSSASFVASARPVLLSIGGPRLEPAGREGRRDKHPIRG
jgi:hypothetical protein